MVSGTFALFCLLTSCNIYITEENDTDFLLSVLNALARSKGMAQVAADLGVSREGLYKSLTPGSNPAFGTVVKTLDNLGFKLNIELKRAS
jgi:probable addiction module antidote protein